MTVIKPRLLLLILVIAVTSALHGQMISSRSNEVSLRVSSESRLPNPLLLAVSRTTLAFTDESGNRKLDAAEKGKIVFAMVNEGVTDAHDLNWVFKIIGDSANIRLDANPVPLLVSGDSTLLEVNVTAGEKLRSGSAIVILLLRDPNGFDSNPVMVMFETVAFDAPEVVVADGIFTSLYSGKMKRNVPTTLRLLIQNNGVGIAEKVKLTLDLPENVVNLGVPTMELGHIMPGQSRMIDVEFIANARYEKTEVPITIRATESYGKYGSEMTFTTRIDEPLSSFQIGVRGINNEQIASSATLLRSLVDVNVPETTVKHPNRYALIIGNEDYMQFQTSLSREQNVAFARNDAMVFREYAIKTLGCPENQVYILTDATKGQMSREIKRITELVKLQPGSELIFYYAGHGLPDFATQKGYLIPVDVSAPNVKDGIALSELYATLASSHASRITVFLDACFSGGGRGENGLLAARTIKIKATSDLVDGNIIVYTATSGEEASLPLKRESHGLFTYHLLQKLKDTGGVLTMQELREHLEKEIPKSSLTENGMKQTPQVLVSPKLAEGWAKWQF